MSTQYLNNIKKSVLDLVEQLHAYEGALSQTNHEARVILLKVKERAKTIYNELNEYERAAESLDKIATKQLTKREQEVLTLVAKGLTNNEIAHMLALSERTVQFHLKSVFTKTGTQSRTEAVALAIQNHWINC